MSLHGEILVSGESIGDWGARRIEKLKGRDETHEYDVHVTLYDNVFHWQGRIHHRYSDGAVALAAKALAAATDKANQEPIGLTGLRLSVGATQVEVAELMGTSQSRVSQIENASLDRLMVRTLRSYARALGGEIEINLVKDGEVTPIRLSNLA